VYRRKEEKDDKSILESKEDAFSFSRYYYSYGIRNSFGLDFDPVTGSVIYDILCATSSSIFNEICLG
jgi:hypothetical protein